MKRLLLWLFFIGIFIPGLHAQQTLPDLYEIKSDTAYQHNLDSLHWQIFADKAGTLTIEQISGSQYADQFKYKIGNKIPVDTTANVYWVRFRLKNITDQNMNIALDSRSEQNDFYMMKTGGQWEHFVTGQLYPWSKKDGFKKGNYIPVSLKPGEELQVYNREYNFDKGVSENFLVDFVNADREIKTEFNLYENEDVNYFGTVEMLEAFLIGILFISSFFNLFFYRIVREKEFFFFSLYLIFYALNRFHKIVEVSTFFIDPQLNRYVFFLEFSWAFLVFFFMQFIRYFFKTFTVLPVWDRILIGVRFLLVLATPLTILSYFFFHSWFLRLLFINRSLYGLGMLTALITLVLLIRKPGKYTKLVILGALPMLLFYLTISPFLSGSMFYNPNLQFGFFTWVSSHYTGIEVICTVWLLVIFSRVLFLRYNELRIQNAQQTLEKERMEREQEMERNQLIARQKLDLEKQVVERTAELKQSLEELKSTQAQLIQSEKMASLGELTAGIAHEIQNPLNFVNNFSEVSNELIDDMNAEMDKGDMKEARAIASDIRQNLEKITHHGKRADSIVKSMLMHSRNSTGAKESTDINALTDEYLRMAFHGQRAREMAFNVTLKTDYDESVGRINIVSQDVGRVILNLISNAFYAVSEKKKLNIEGYEPAVSVSTRKMADHIKIRVADNGTGIPQKILQKIFQPFFTTKPTGEGTGLGLSLSYDIIKAAGGELIVETREKEGTDFVVQLPLI